MSMQTRRSQMREVRKSHVGKRLREGNDMLNFVSHDLDDQASLTSQACHMHHLSHKQNTSDIILPQEAKP